MAKRASGERPFATMKGSAPPSAGSNSPPTNAACSSRSEGMALLRHTFGDRGLLQQHREGGNVSVPFDEGRNRSEALDRLAVEIPHGGRYALAMGVDEQAVEPVVAGEMDLLHHS